MFLFRWTRYSPLHPRKLGYRGYATAARNDPAKFRNMALVAHIGP
jgi:hypothetical protein